MTAAAFYKKYDDQKGFGGAIIKSGDLVAWIDRIGAVLSQKPLINNEIAKTCLEWMKKREKDKSPVANSDSSNIFEYSIIAKASSANP